MGAGAEGKPKPPAVRVVVVDDSPVDRKVVELLLRNHKHGAAAPFHVTAVDSGKKAMELLLLGLTTEAGLAVDVVLTDYCMPEMTGYDLVKAIKALSSPTPIPVVVMSSENEPQRISRCLTAGAEDFILKPLRPEDVQRLRSCSGSGRRRLPEEHGGGAAPPCGSLTGLATAALNNAGGSSSSAELSHYFQFQFVFKLALLAYAVLCLGELLHRCSNGSFLSLWSA